MLFTDISNNSAIFTVEYLQGEGHLKAGLGHLG